MIGHRVRTATLLRRIAPALIGLAIAALPTIATAARYNGYGDTGFGYINRAECCEEAIFRAQDDSGLACERVGGYPDYPRSGARGRCETERKRGSNGQTIFRCTATAAVDCR
jgi:hypothetical protein